MIKEWLDGSWEDGVARTLQRCPERGAKLRAIGNAVVPQVAQWLGERIVEVCR